MEKEAEILTGQGSYKKLQLSTCEAVQSAVSDTLAICNVHSFKYVSGSVLYKL